MKILRWIVALPIVVVAAVFAVHNRQPVTVDLWPLPFEFDIWLVLLLYLALLVGVLFGLLAGWIAASAGRRARPAKAPPRPEPKREAPPAPPATTGGVPAVRRPDEQRTPAQAD